MYYTLAHWTLHLAHSYTLHTSYCTLHLEQCSMKQPHAAHILQHSASCHTHLTMQHWQTLAVYITLHPWLRISTWKIWFLVFFCWQKIPWCDKCPGVQRKDLYLIFRRNESVAGKVYDKDVRLSVYFSFTKWCWWYTDQNHHPNLNWEAVPVQAGRAGVTYYQPTQKLR